MNPRRLFVASCIALVTSAFTFVVRADVLQPMGDAFSLSQQEKGSLEGAVFLGMAASMLVGGFICDLLGMKRIMWLAFLCHLVGVLGTIFAPHTKGISFWWLFSAAFLMGCGNGMVETGINPLVATLYPTEKTHYLNILHAWWPGGLVIGGLAVKFIHQGIDLGFLDIPGMNLTFPGFPSMGIPGLASWQLSLVLIVIPCLVYGAILIGQRFPLTERVESGVSTDEMYRQVIRPAFLLWGFCMLLTAATELGPQKWQESVMTRTAGVSGTLILVYTSGLMFVMRHFAGPLAHAVSPIGMLTVSAILSGVGLYLLSTATDGVTAFTYATIFGLGIAYFWPTMLGVTSERFPKGGALALCLMGSFGNLSISQVLPQMGRIYDTYAVQTLQSPETGDPQLAARVVKDGAINQNLVKHLSLLTKFSDDELRSMQEGSYLLSNQQASSSDLSPAQQLIMKGLQDDKGTLITEWNKFVAELKEQQPNHEFAPQQEEVLDHAGGLVRSLAGLNLLRQVQAAQLTDTQKAEVAKILQEAGQTEAADALQAKDFDPDKLLEKQKKAIAAAIEKIDLTEPQQELRKQKEAVDQAEKEGAKMAFRWVTVLPAVLVVIFGLIWLKDLMTGGYRAIHISEGKTGQ